MTQNSSSNTDETDPCVTILHTTLVEGEDSGSPESFDFDAFIDAKKA